MIIIFAYISAQQFKALSTLIHFQTKTELFCSGYSYRPHYNAKNDHWKWSHSKMLSRVEWFENDAFWKRCFLVSTRKAMLSENGEVIKVGMTGRQTTRPWVSKMADRSNHVASILRQFRRPIYWNAHTLSSFDHAHWGYNSIFKQIQHCSVDGRKRYENDKCGRKSFLKRSKTAPFSFENGLVCTGPKRMFFHLKLPEGWMFSKVKLGDIANSSLSLAETKFYQVGLALPCFFLSFANFNLTCYLVTTQLIASSGVLYTLIRFKATTKLFALLCLY